MIQVDVSNLFFTEVDSSGVTLLEKGGNGKLQIIIGDYEAQAIALALENIQPPRPITHDLLAAMVQAADLQVDRLVISRVKNNTYFAELYITRNGLEQMIDLRPSDGIALSVRLNFPIFVADDLLKYDTQTEDGKITAKTDESLDKQLQRAVENEDYERAAKLRDLIRKQGRS